MSSSETVCRLIAGLGNPGSEYAGTRHNAGFEVVDRFLARHAKMFRRRSAHAAEAWEGGFAGNSLILLKPLTFMNLSGEAVAPVMRGEKLLPEEILVVYDDMDLPVGRIRLRPNGGSAGHNGMKSVIEALGTEKFPRMRIGTGMEGAGRDPDYVLSGFDGELKKVYDGSLDRAADALELYLRRGLQAAMNLCNPPPEPAENEAQMTSVHALKHNTPQEV